MPDDLLIGAVVQIGADLALVAIVFAVMWAVNRVWGDRGLAWLLGKTEDDLRRRSVDGRGGRKGGE